MSEPATAADEWDRAHLWRFRAQLVRIKDADTIVVLADTGYHGRHEAVLRLARIDAPESNTPEGKMATHWLASMLTWGAPMPWSPWNLRVVSLQKETVVTEVTTFERFVAEVYWLREGGVMVNASDALTEAGHAVRWEAP